MLEQFLFEIHENEDADPELRKYAKIAHRIITAAKVSALEHVRRKVTDRATLEELERYEMELRKVTQKLSQYEKRGNYRPDPYHDA